MPHQLSKLDCQTTTWRSLMCPLKPCIWVWFSTVHWSLHHMYAVFLVRVSSTSNRWRLYEGHCLKWLLRPWCMYAFVTSEIHYCNSILYGVSTVHLWPLQNLLNSAARVILHKQRLDHITVDIRDLLHWLPVQHRIEYKKKVLQYRCLLSHHPSTILSYASRLQQLPNGVVYFQKYKATSLSHTVGQNDMDKEVLPIPVQFFSTHFHWQFMTHHYHWLSFVRNSFCSPEHNDTSRLDLRGSLGCKVLRKHKCSLHTYMYIQGGPKNWSVFES